MSEKAFKVADAIGNVVVVVIGDGDGFVVVVVGWAGVVASSSCRKTMSPVTSVEMWSVVDREIFKNVKISSNRTRNEDEIKKYLF